MKTADCRPNCIRRSSNAIGTTRNGLSSSARAETHSAAFRSGNSKYTANGAAATKIAEQTARDSSRLRVNPSAMSRSVSSGFCTSASASPVDASASPRFRKIVAVVMTP